MQGEEKMQYKENAETIETVERERERERVVFSKIGFICVGKNASTIRSKNKERNKTKVRMGYIAEVQKDKKIQKLLHKSLSFL